MRSPRGAVTVRPALLVDRAATEALIGLATTHSPYAEAPAYFVRRAFDVGDSEARVVVAELGGGLVGCAIYGDVAGAVGTGRIHFVAVSSHHQRAGIGASLCEAAIGDLRARGARIVIVEMPDDAVLAPGRSLVESCGFAVVARVADYYRDAVDLIVLERTST